MSRQVDRAMGKKILTIDDSKLASVLTKRLFEEAGYVVVQASSVAEGLRTLDAEHGIDLIVTDFNMPELTGLDFIKSVRKQNRDIPIYVLSANTEPENRIDSMNAGANGWISKPITPSALSEILNYKRKETHAPIL